MSIKDKFDLSNKVAIVTGSGQGIGEGIAIALAEAGANLSIIDINIDTANRVLEKIKQINRNPIAIKCDVSNYSQVEKMRDDTLKAFGHIDILVNNAAIGALPIPTEDLDLEKWNKIIEINLTGVFICSQVVGRTMIKQKNGRIINISSMTGMIVNKGFYVAPYASAKAGVIMLTKSLAMDWSKYNIRVNAIAPGYFNTSLNAHIIENKELYNKVIELVPIGRFGDVSELGGAVVFLSSDASSYITGHIMVIDGGYTVW
jgi:NAD(P)-dependent dehydrogenase (short-subunit alcohol dehydrogenase family)